jgi:hypothetical protein
MEERLNRYILFLLKIIPMNLNMEDLEVIGGAEDLGSTDIVEVPDIVEGFRQEDLKDLNIVEDFHQEGLEDLAIMEALDIMEGFHQKDLEDLGIMEGFHQEDLEDLDIVEGFHQEDLEDLGIMEGFPQEDLEDLGIMEALDIMEGFHQEDMEDLGILNLGWGNAEDHHHLKGHSLFHPYIQSKSDGVNRCPENFSGIIC